MLHEHALSEAFRVPVEFAFFVCLLYPQRRIVQSDPLRWSLPVAVFSYYLVLER
jgi:hypothetical protein